ncbi:ParB N-terminal domain-containing protein [Paenibacillus abyssi]|uniref:ParB-like N-terminal domain-containing protein n=1 Tax=Paenibacillus abyssi TaxID=1340531 RepID=A0A917CJT6_9BACL|nr:ParB N-terminal domain-containing protein [Paenibacillus abyssi]GGF88001.1 hypothetical protein GCM10010916_01660 [Paenibacillus abyssi]
MAVENEPIFQYVNPNDLIEHPESHRIPEMSPEEWTDFSTRVEERGEITDPVFALKNGKVFDGRHRLRKAKEIGIRLIPVLFFDITEDEALRRMADSAVLRRQLEPGQRAAIVLEFTELVEKVREEARERQRKAAEETNMLLGRIDTVIPDLGEATPKSTVSRILAEKASIGKSSMEYLMAVQRDEPDLFAKVKSGDMTINKAYTETKKRKESQSPSNIVKMPKRPSAKKSRLDEIKRNAEADEKVPQVGGQSTLSEDNLLRYRAERDFRDYAVRFVADYDALLGADRESTDIYITKLKRVIEGGLLLIAEFDNNEHTRELAEQVAEVIRESRTEEGQRIISETMGGNGR